MIRTYNTQYRAVGFNVMNLRRSATNTELIQSITQDGNQLAKMLYGISEDDKYIKFSAVDLRQIFNTFKDLALETTPSMSPGSYKDCLDAQANFELCCEKLSPQTHSKICFELSI